MVLEYTLIPSLKTLFVSSDVVLQLTDFAKALVGMYRAAESGIASARDGVEVGERIPGDMQGFAGRYVEGLRDACLGFGDVRLAVRRMRYMVEMCFDVRTGSLCVLNTGFETLFNTTATQPLSIHVQQVATSDQRSRTNVDRQRLSASDLQQTLVSQ